MLSRLVHIKAVTIGMVTVLGTAGSANAVDASKRLPASGTPHEAVAPAPYRMPVDSATPNIRVDVPVVPNRHTLDKLCGSLLENHPARGVDHYPPPQPDLRILVQVTGGTVEASASWCTAYLGYPEPAQRMHHVSTSSTKAAHRSESRRTAVGPSGTLPASDFGPVVSSTGIR